MLIIQINKDNDGWISRAFYNNNLLNIESFDYQKTQESSIDKILDEIYNLDLNINLDNFKIEYTKF